MSNFGDKVQPAVKKETKNVRTIKKRRLRDRGGAQ